MKNNALLIHNRRLDFLRSKVLIKKQKQKSGSNKRVGRINGLVVGGGGGGASTGLVSFSYFFSVDALGL